MKTFSAVCVIAVLATSVSNGLAADSFDQSIRPLLRDDCVTCHSTEKQEGIRQRDESPGSSVKKA